MANKFEKNFGFKDTIKFVIPSIIMQVFLSLYTVVDGMFVSRFVSTLALSSMNMVFPVINIEMGVGIMLATGGSAIVARRMGEKKEQKARQNFTFLILISFVVGLIFTTLSVAFIDEIVVLLGASRAQFEMCRQYAVIMLAFTPVMFLQVLFQTFFVAAGKPNLGLISTVAAGGTNILLDWIFVKELSWGVSGAAFATGIGYCLPAIMGLIFFAKNKNGSLYFVRPVTDWRMLVKSCTNGSSEMVSNLAYAVTTYLFNIKFMKYYGESGVASITIILYFQFILLAIFFGYSIGVSPIISYKYGSEDHSQLKKIVKDSFLFVAISSAFAYGISFVIIDPVLKLFAGNDKVVYDISVDGFPLFALSFLVMGVGIFASAMFTALSDGPVSALISFGRTLVFLSVTIIVLPTIIGSKGLWLSVPLAELLGAILSAVFLLLKRKKYKY